jgi:EmrB/QacA subfamily drug resistance transporter
VTLGSLILLAGSLSDVFGRKRVLRAGLIGFAVTSLACGFAPTGVVLVAARALQGVAGALLVPSSLAIIISTFSGAAQGKAIGRWTAWTGISAIAGPVLGGVFVDLLSWRFVFMINVVPIAVTLWLLVGVGQDERRVGGRVDYAGAVLGAAGLGASVFALIEQGTYGWGAPQVWLSLSIGVASMAAFFVVQARSSVAMLPVSIFRVHNFWVGNVATAVIYGALAFGPFILVLYLQQVAEFSATEAGIAMIPATVMMLALSGLFGSLADRHGPRLFMALGPTIAAAGFVAMMVMGRSVNYWTELLPGVLLFGIGLSITVAPLTSAILDAIDPAQAGIGSAVNNAVARVAGLVTVAFAGILIGGTLDYAGMQRALLATAILMLAGGAISAVGIRNPKLVQATSA